MRDHHRVDLSCWPFDERILAPWPRRGQGHSYRPISLFRSAVKILNRLLLPSILEALVTCSSQHGFNPRHSTNSALLPISTRVVSGFYQRKPPSRTIAIAVDINKVSHRLLIKMIHRSRLCHNLVRWLVAYLRGSKASCFYQQHHSNPRQVRAGVPQGSIIFPAFFNHFVLDCPIPDLYMTSYADVCVTSHCCPLLPASWRQRRRQTNCFLLW